MTDFFSCSSYFVHQRLNWVGLVGFVRANWLNAKLIQSRKYWCHRSVGGAKKDAAADADEYPAKPFQNRLPFEVTVKLFRCVPPLAVAFHSEASLFPFHHEVNPVSTDYPLRLHLVTGCKESLEYLGFKHRISLFAVFLHRSMNCLRIPCILDESATQIASLEMSFWVKRMYDPKLVAGATYSDIIAFLIKIFRPSVAIRKLTVLRRPIDH